MIKSSQTLFESEQTTFVSDANETSENTGEGFIVPTYIRVVMQRPAGILLMLEHIAYHAIGYLAKTRLSFIIGRWISSGRKRWRNFRNSTTR